MKKIFLTLSALCALTLGAFAQAQQDFTFENDTSYTIWGLHVSPHSSNRWGGDVLGRDTLEPDQNTYIYWNEPQSATYYDIRVDFRNGAHWDFQEGINLREASYVWVTWDGNQANLHWR